MFRSLVVAALLATAGTAQAQVRAGVWDLEIAFGGGIMQGRIEVTMPRRDSLAVAMFVGDHQSPIRLTRREGNTLILDSTTPGVEIHYELEFRGDEVRGPFRYSGDTGSVTGRRRSS